MSDDDRERMYEEMRLHAEWLRTQRLAEMMESLAERQEPVEPEFYRALYENRSEMYLKSDA